MYKPEISEPTKEIADIFEWKSSNRSLRNTPKEEQTPPIIAIFTNAAKQTSQL